MEPIITVEEQILFSNEIADKYSQLCAKPENISKEGNKLRQIMRDAFNFYGNKIGVQPHIRMPKKSLIESSIAHRVAADELTKLCVRWRMERVLENGVEYYYIKA